MFKARRTGFGIDSEAVNSIVMATANKPQDFQIGTTSLKQVSFVTPLNKVGDPPNEREDGVLPTAAFQRVFISYSEGYATFEPWAR
jgi:hypothetical protein